MVKPLRVPPKCLGPSLTKTIKDLLTSEVEGSCIDGAFVVAVLEIYEPLPKGLIEPLEGFVRFDVKYSAIFMKPFKNEVLDATVSQVTALGFFAEAGPLNIFVSRVNMPSDIVLSDDGSAWVGPSGDEIKSGVDVRLKIISAGVQASHLAGIGSIDDAFLGVIKRL